MSDMYGWLLTFFILISLLGIISYQLMCLTDLQFDFMNPYDSEKWINILVLPEFVTQGLLSIAYLITGHWLFCLSSLPYLYYNVRLYLNKQHLVHVTEIYNQLHREKKQRMYKLGYLTALLGVSLFWLIWST